MKQANLLSFFQRGAEEPLIRNSAPTASQEYKTETKINPGDKESANDQPKKRRTLYYESDEEADDFPQPKGKKKAPKDDDYDEDAGSDDDDEDFGDLDEESDERPNKKGASKKKSQSTNKPGNKSNNKKVTSQGKIDEETAPEVVQEEKGLKGKFDAEGNPNLDMFKDPTPWWATKEHMRDKNKRKPDDPLYDPTTLYIPPDEIHKLTPAKRQYWQIKAAQFDQIIFFKLGKFYELFDQDAVVGVQVLGLAFMGDTMHAGVPESALDKFADRLVQLGYKVAIVEQTESVRELKSRVSAGGLKPHEKIIKRDLIKVLTKGTYTSPNEAGIKLNANYLWVFRNYGEGYALVITELSLNMSWIAYLPKDENYSTLKMLIYQLKPSEVVVDPSNLTREISKIFANISSGPTITKIANAATTHFWNAMVMSEIYAKEPFIQVLENAVAGFEDEESRGVAKSVFAGLVNYLGRLKILENHINILNIEKYNQGTQFQQRMVMDAQALEQLEVLEATHDFRTKADDSLLSVLDQCVSQPGKRLLKSLICAPYMSPEVLNSRLDALEELNANPQFVRDFQKHLQQAGDFERVLARLFKYSLKQKEKFILFEDVSSIRLRELKNMLATLTKLFDVLSHSSLTCNWKSSLLKKLTTGESKGGLLKENLKQEITEMSQHIVWTGEDNNIPIPKAGTSAEYDQTKLKIKAVDQELHQYLETQKKALKCQNVEFAHTKLRYEISVPEDLKVPSEYSFSSCKKGFKRYSTPMTTKLVDKMEGLEEELKNHMKNFALFIFEYFNSKRTLWENVPNICKELDVLCSLAAYSFKSNGKFVRPRFWDNDHKSFIDLKQSRHPIVSRIQDNFVPNDISIGDRSQDKVILLTGPNMGGKSTVLRQTCLIAIIAQLGCYVPAESCEMTPVDRIFTRLGASDKLVEGKSTFFVEMEDIFNLVTFGTDRSLAIIDELGRGTSTADGFAIAASILDHIVKKIGCLSIFSTHYHSLINFCLEYDTISFYKMDYMIDEATQDIVFLYKLAEGVCNRSFGIKVGRIAGIDSAILARAEQISNEIDTNINKNFRDEIDLYFDSLVTCLTTGGELGAILSKPVGLLGN